MNLKERSQSNLVQESFITSQKLITQIGTLIDPLLELSILVFFFNSLGLYKPEYNLTNLDIEYSVPKCVKFNSSRGYNDPLNPKYQLPQVEMRPITPPKFIKDSISHDDIDGSRPKKQAYYET